MGLVHQESQKNNTLVGYRNLQTRNFAAVNNGLLAWWIKRGRAAPAQLEIARKEIKRRWINGERAMRRHHVPLAD